MDMDEQQLAPHTTHRQRRKRLDMHTDTDIPYAGTLPAPLAHSMPGQGDDRQRQQSGRTQSLLYSASHVVPQGSVMPQVPQEAVADMSFIMHSMIVQQALISCGWDHKALYMPSGRCPAHITHICHIATQNVILQKMLDFSGHPP